jgi:hypothetical protein
MANEAGPSMERQIGIEAFGLSPRCLELRSLGPTPDPDRVDSLFPDWVRLRCDVCDNLVDSLMQISEEVPLKAGLRTFDCNALHICHNCISRILNDLIRVDGI